MDIQNMSDGGKGDKRRPTDEQKYQDNWDIIFGKKKEKCSKMCSDTYTECQQCKKVLDKSKQE